MELAFEDVRTGLAEDRLIVMVQKMMNALHRNLSSVLDNQYKNLERYTAISIIHGGSNREDLENNVTAFTADTGGRIKVFWLAELWFYAGDATIVHDGQHQVTYDDGGSKVHNVG